MWQCNQLVQWNNSGKAHIGMALLPCKTHLYKSGLASVTEPPIPLALLGDGTIHPSSNPDPSASLPAVLPVRCWAYWWIWSQCCWLSILGGAVSQAVILKVVTCVMVRLVGDCTATNVNISFSSIAASGGKLMLCGWLCECSVVCPLETGPHVMTVLCMSKSSSSSGLRGFCLQVRLSLGHRFPTSEYSVNSLHLTWE